jgi:LEA14-like dessication related protein
MKRFYYLLVLSLLLASCEFDEPEINGFSNIKVGKLQGKNLDLDFDAKILNDNTYNIAIKKSKLKVFLNDIELGDVVLNDKIKLKKKTEQNYHVSLAVTVANGILLKLPKLANATNHELHLVGTARASVMGFGKTFQVDEKRKISKDNLNVKELIQGLTQGN